MLLRFYLLPNIASIDCEQADEKIDSKRTPHLRALPTEESISLHMQEMFAAPKTNAGPRGLHGRKQQSTFRGRQGEHGRIGKSD